MAKSLNQWNGLGVLGRDAETAFTSGGKSVTKFSIATSNSYKKGDEWVENTDWHNIVLWGAEKLGEYLKKGTKVMITGRYTNRSYDDKDGNKKYVSEVIADSVILCGGKAQAAAGGGAVDDRDVPF